MAASKIETPREFFDNVADLDVSDFQSSPVDLRAAFHACTSILSLRDWIFEAYKNMPWSYRSAAQTPFRSKNEFQTALERFDRNFQIVTDVANASKHMILNPDQSRTNLYGSANTEVAEIQGGAIGSGPIGSAPTGGTSSRIVVKIDDTYHDVKDCIISTNNVWRTLFAENSW